MVDKPPSDQDSDSEKAKNLIIRLGGEPQPGLHMMHLLMILHAWLGLHRKTEVGSGWSFYRFVSVHTLDVND